MLTGQALEIVLIMAKTTTTSRTDKGQEAIKEVEFLLTSFEDTGDTEERICFECMDALAPEDFE